MFFYPCPHSVIEAIVGIIIVSVIGIRIKGEVEGVP